MLPVYIDMQVVVAWHVDELEHVWVDELEHVWASVHPTLQREQFKHHHMDDDFRSQVRAA